jgi:tRNA (Thr-GGU) A37 N-methylase
VSDGRQDNFFKTNEECEMNEVKLTPVGFVKNDREDASDFEWGRVESEIVFEPGYADGLLGLEQFSHAIVVFHFNRALDEAPTLRRRPRGRDDMPMTGVFAQRGANRPNRLGVTAVEIVRHRARARRRERHAGARSEALRADVRPHRVGADARVGRAAAARVLRHGAGSGVRDRGGCGLAQGMGVRTTLVNASAFDAAPSTRRAVRSDG